mmetsp:Transcript_22886/g.47475  ORF Transcript_22886/g.47475 Transcript_22886/m.47475 type:complete len:520 (-) Transcript_22886:80-1639(-)|eukprot:CAMPEP_0118656636 /NCGR_PEP_ID=MMETSP0785-20121206/13590_1 /TAXON_ID=91992 /ORGANISM="Bolidomonas pacifica, Strain CCMP 1866" /LENGTH=519 /DNA_ID=CAMNT_0006549499 /DNA_START=80 /DNA_END=1639 /DNA_ORIENTATION=-
MGACNSAPEKTTVPVAGASDKVAKQNPTPPSTDSPKETVKAQVEPPAEVISKAEPAKTDRPNEGGETVGKKIEKTSEGKGKKEPVQVIEKLLKDSKTGFLDDYTIGTDLGSGSFSVVKQAIHKQSGEIYAVKVIKRSSLPADEVDALRDEVSILGEVKHRNIIHMIDFYEESEHYYLVMEIMDGGELFDRIVQKSFYNEKEARDLVKILLEAINYMHERNIVHRDLKPENLLLASTTSDSDIRLADFGFAKRVEKPLSTQCGTPGYVAPEILKGDKYGLSVDMWSIGVITYILLGGYPPFHDDNQAVLYRKIKEGNFDFHPEYWDPVSKEAKNLIKSMLTVNVKDRLTAKNALDDPWINMSDVELQSHDLNGTLDEIKKFNARRKLKGTIKAVMAMTKMKRLIESLTQASKQIDRENGVGASNDLASLLSDEQVAEFKGEFNKFDENGDGTITTEELSVVMNNLGQHPTEQQLKDMVEEVDIDKNGTIEFGEFIVMMAKLMGAEPNLDAGLGKGAEESK